MLPALAPVPEMQDFDDVAVDAVDQQMGRAGHQAFACAGDLAG